MHVIRRRRGNEGRVTGVKMAEHEGELYNLHILYLNYLLLAFVVGLVSNILLVPFIL